MRQELIEKIIFILRRNGVQTDEIESDIIILLNDYEVSKRETAISVQHEDINAHYLKKFIVAKSVKGCTERTIRLYGTELKKIIEAIGKPIPEIVADDIRYYLAIRERRDKVTRTTIGNELRYMRSFFGWLHNEEMIRRNPTVKIDSIKGRKIQKKAFTEVEVEKIRDACNNSKETAIVEILLSTGCRVTELVNIRTQDISDNSIVVRGKGEKDRVVYLNAKSQIAIEKYINEREDNNQYLFPKMLSIKEMKRNHLRDAFKYKENVLLTGHMDQGSVESVVRRLGKRCGVENVHPHRFRRTCATLALRRGMPIEQVSKMLGHEQLATTQIYLDLDEKDLEQAHRKYVV